MKTGRPVKVAAFCRELGDNTLLNIALGQEGMEPVYQAAEEALRAGRIGPELEASIDKLDDMVRGDGGQGLYPSGTRAYPGRFPGSGLGSSAQWWTCPRGWCSGRGRVRPQQDPPFCAAAGKPLEAGPLPA